MSHVTEGLLHAYLDGALTPELELEWAEAEGHLEGCADCRRMMAEARDLRDAAGSLLYGSAVPSGPAPAFADLRPKAKARPGATSARAWFGSTSRLAWAASLVLAAGAGWMGRELLIQNSQSVPSLVSESARDEADADLMASAEAEAPAEVAARERSVGDRAARANDAPEPMAETQKLEGDVGREGRQQQDAGADNRLDQLQARVAEESLTDDSQDARVIAVAREIMAAAHFAALISLDETGHPRARTMDPFPPEEDLTIWMATNPASRKVTQIRRDPRVIVYYFDAVGLGYVTLAGEARIVDDPVQKERRWKPEWEAFYPDRDSSYILIEIRPNRLEVVSEKHGLSGDPVTWTPDGLFIGPH